MKILIALLLLVSCSSTKLPKANPNTFYKRDMVIKHGGVDYIGGAVLPYLAVYDLHIIAKGDLDLFSFQNCHRDETSENAWNVSEKKRTFIFKRTKELKKEIKITFTPTFLEKKEPCPVFLTALEEAKGRHSFGYIDFGDPYHKLPAEIHCNGDIIISSGVSHCQSREGLVQRITFKKKVRTSPDKLCAISALEGVDFEIPLAKGNCIYLFMSDDKAMHRLTTYGFESILLRE